MSSIAETQPRTGRRNFTLRAYLAGTAATAALLGAVVLVFASLGAYVAFNGLPIGGDQASDPTSIEVGAAAQQTKAAHSAHHQQIANATVHGQNASGASGGPSANAGSNTGDASSVSGQPTASPASPVAPTATNTPTDSANGSGTVVTVGPSQDSPSGGGDSSPLPTPQVTTPDSVGSTVGTVEQTLHQAGVDVPLNDAGSAVDQVTDGLLGGNH